MRIKRYSDEDRQALVNKYRMEGNPPLTVFAKANGVSYITLKRFIEEAEGTGTDVAPIPQPKRVERSGSLREQFRSQLLPDNEKELYIRWLEDRVKYLEGELAQFTDRQDDH
ncbi:hypothetical protein SB18R_04210 [Pseudomonas oryzihabitans]|nr:hypothetical protein SB9_15990 [Pseudomonas psychrotolerans]KTT77867.1 hypothetical protein SB18R_04210 [Pseudomonas psychrotolerans]